MIRTNKSIHYPAVYPPPGALGAAWRTRPGRSPGPPEGSVSAREGARGGLHFPGGTVDMTGWPALSSGLTTQGEQHVPITYRGDSEPPTSDPDAHCRYWRERGRRLGGAR